MDIGRTEKLSITVSVLFHALILAWLAFGLGGTGAGPSVQYMAVELFESPGGAQAPSGEPKAHALEPERSPVNPPVQKSSVRPRFVKTPSPQAPVVEKVQPRENPAPHETRVDEDTMETPDSTLTGAEFNELAMAVPIESLQRGQSAEAGMDIGDGDSRQAGNGGLAAVREVRIGAIRTAIQSVVVYPPIARRRGLEGTVLASFLVDEKGLPHNVQVLQSSGYGIFDREVVRVIHAASPYPTVDVAVEVPVTFRLSDIASR